VAHSKRKGLRLFLNAFQENDMTTMDIDRATEVAAPERRSHGLLAGILGLLKRMEERRVERATLIELSRMNAYMLRDMGIEPRDIYDALDGRKNSVLLNPIRRG
jgi:uncharacterized protein YjiS (DUF1127 family)